MVALSLVISIWLPAQSSREVTPKPVFARLTTVQQVRQLSPEHASRALPVKVSGVVTYVDKDHFGDFFIQDQSSGIYVKPSKLSKGLRHGDLVIVEGVSNAGEFAPCLSAMTVTVLKSNAPLPTPLPFNLSAEDSRWLDGQWVMAWGVLSKVEAEDRFTVLTLYSAHGNAIVRIPDRNWASALKNAVNTTLRIQAVCVPVFDPTTRMIRADHSRLLTNMVPMLPTISMEPLRSEAIDHLMRFNPLPYPGGQRAKLTGVVVGVSDVGTIYVQDATGGAAIVPEKAVTGVNVGDRVEVIGLVGIEGRRIRIMRAEVKQLGPDKQPVPMITDLAALNQGLHYSTRVTVTGRVEDLRQAHDRAMFTLVDGASRVDAALPAGMEAPPLGSRVSITGACGRSKPPSTLNSSPAIWLGDPSDLVVLASPPVQQWLTTPRVVAMIAAVATLTLFAFAWVFTLRKQVRRQTEELQQRFAGEHELAEKLRTSRRLEAIGRLAGGIAHDFNNLLTVISGCSELLQSQVTENRNAVELVKDIRTAGDRAASLVAQLLLFSKQQPVSMTAVDLSAVVHETDRILRRIIGENIDLKCETAVEVPLVHADVTLIQQIILNLAVNARDAMPNGGTLTIRTEEMAGPTARLIVSDTGTGMDEATKARIFEPFFTTKDVGRGTGLGLATVYGIVQTLKGEIRCNTAPGAGTTFEIDLPAKTDVTPTPDLESPQQTFKPGRGRVLLVEDDAAVRGLTSKILTTAGYNVQATHSPRQALTIGSDLNETVDLLLTDQVMPEMSGRELAEQLRRLRPTLKVLYISGYLDGDAARKTESGFALLEKPFTPTELTIAVESMLSTNSR